jgi:hypothetical protein
MVTWLLLRHHHPMTAPILNLGTVRKYVLTLYPGRFNPVNDTGICFEGYWVSARTVLHV